MYIITGNNIYAQQVRILDTTDMSDDWLPYTMLKAGLNQGLTVGGMTQYGILCQASDLAQELAPKFLDYFNGKEHLTKPAICRILRHYGFADTNADFSVNLQKKILHCYKINKDLCYNQDVPYERSRLEIPLIENDLAKKQLVELKKIPAFGADNIITRIYRYTPNHYIIIFKDGVAEVKFEPSSILDSVELRCHRDDFALSYYISQISSKSPYFISEFSYNSYGANHYLRNKIPNRIISGGHIEQIYGPPYDFMKDNDLDYYKKLESELTDEERRYIKEAKPIRNIRDMLR